MSDPSLVDPSIIGGAGATAGVSFVLIFMKLSTKVGMFLEEVTKLVKKLNEQTLPAVETYVNTTRDHQERVEELLVVPPEDRTPPPRRAGTPVAGMRRPTR